MTYISKHISYHEATYSNTAVRRNIDNTPGVEELHNMKTLANRIFEPLRSHFNEPIRINSFFRSVTLNNRIGGAKSSQHVKGEAIDISGTNGVTNKQLFDWIRENLEYDQLIAEFGYKWIHVSYTTSKPNRKQVLEAVKVNGKTKYIKL